MINTTRPQFARRLFSSVRLALPLGCIALGLGACAEQAQQRQGLTRPAQTTESRPLTRTPAVVEGKAVSWSTLQTMLAEASGGRILDELALDGLVERELARAGLALSEADIAREAELLDASLLGAGATRASLERIRAQRGLGPERYPRLLKRSAGLRALVQDEVSVADSEIRLAHEIRTGPRVLVRVIRTSSEREAAAARAQILASQQPRSLAFADAAVKGSIDSSAPRGGLLDPLSLADPAWPDAVRDTIRRLDTGGISPVIALDDGHAIVLLEQKIDGTGEQLTPQRTERYRSELMARKERLAMENLARSLLGSADITPLDPHLSWSWESHRGSTP